MASEVVVQGLVKLDGDGSGAIKASKDTQDAVAKAGNESGGMSAKFGTAMKAVGASIAAGTAAAIAFGKESITAFNDANLQLTRLQSIGSQAGWAQTQIDGLNKLSASMENVGVVDHNVTTAGQAQLATFALSSDTVGKLSSAMDNLIANTAGYNSTTSDAMSVANLMGKAMGGNAGALTKYGVQMTDAQKKTLQFGTEAQKTQVVLDAINNSNALKNLNADLAKTPQGQMKQLGMSLDGVKESLGGLLEGKVSPDQFVSALDDFVNKGIAVVTTMAPKLITGITSALTAIANKLPDLVSGMLPPLIQGFISIVNGVVAALPGLINGIVKALPVLLPMILNGALQMFMGIVNAIPKIIPVIVKALPTIIQSVVKALLDNLPTIIKGVVQLVVGLVGAVGQIIQVLVPMIPTIIGEIVKALIENLPTIIAGVLQIFVAILGLIPAFIKAFIGYIANIPGEIMSAVSGITKVFSDIWNKVKDGISGFVGGIGKFFSGIGSAIWDAIKGALKTVLGAIPVIGGTIVKALHLANGGYVVGPGTATSDSVPAMLSNGEYTVKSSSVKSIGKDALDYMNKTGNLLATPAAGGGDTNITVNAPQQADPLALAQQIGQRTRWAVA